ncbi:unnamed protein product [Adineta ricciae]|uniref:Death domain-containing protein n=1 Tax=Adineta ricciae TaxID=249248 RepID=A0A814P6A4_ADIRI|nr:unnamed protein product [Adineta ricciae]
MFGRLMCNRFVGMYLVCLAYDGCISSRKRIKQCSIQYTKKILKKKDRRKEYHCQVYLKLYPTTCKCTLDVIVNSTNEIISDNQSILLARSRLGKVIKPGVVRVRLVSSLFTADTDVHEDPSLTKLEIVKKEHSNHSFDKQFALQLKNNQIGPGVIGKLFLESLDPSNGSYNNESPIYELNLSLSSEYQIVPASFPQKDAHTETCGCILSSDESCLIISDQCNLKLSDTKLIHRLAEPIRCQWKTIGRELAPCFSEVDLLDIHEKYFLADGNHECAYQLLREWYIRKPHQADVRFLMTKFKLTFDAIVKIHDEIRKLLTCK